MSVTQAREPIYTRSINKNKFYENNLNKMFSLLDIKNINIHGISKDLEIVNLSLKKKFYKC